MNTFVNTVNSVNPHAVARTENGMRARASTADPNLDLFGSIGAMRGQDVIPAFTQAFNTNKDEAVRTALWARDIRGGAGERKLVRDILLWLAKNDESTLVNSQILNKLPELGRFDDLLIFEPNSKAFRKAISIYTNYLLQGNGLAAKWAPRKGPVAEVLREALSMSPRQYRKFVVNNTSVVETQMCANNWNEINYEQVPSVAMTRYQKAFGRHDPEGLGLFRNAVSKGEAKVNASAVYPYDILRMLGGARDMSYSYGYGDSFKKENLEVATGMWDALPNYMNDAKMLCVCDNSGSMQSQLAKSQTTVMDVAVSLTMYAASKNTGAFKDLSVSFSEDAKFIQHKGNLIDRLKAVCSAKWGSTNLHSVFNLVLNHAVRNRVSAEDMPDYIVIFSDMQFNNCVHYDDSAIRMIQRKYEDAGYEVPQVIFWNLRDAGNKPVKHNEQGVALVSGFSPALMKSILAADMNRFTPRQVMLDTIMSPRYDWI